MRALMVGYDLRKGESYDSLIKYLKSFPGWWHGLDSTWFVNTNMTVNQVCNELMKHIRKTDHLLVLDPHTGIWSSYNLSDDLNDYLRRNLAA